MVYLLIRVEKIEHLVSLIALPAYHANGRVVVVDEEVGEDVDEEVDKKVDEEVDKKVDEEVDKEH